jgi:hypothetical protein
LYLYIFMASWQILKNVSWMRRGCHRVNASFSMSATLHRSWEHLKWFFFSFTIRSLDASWSDNLQITSKTLVNKQVSNFNIFFFCVSQSVSWMITSIWVEMMNVRTDILLIIYLHVVVMLLEVDVVISRLIVDNKRCLRDIKKRYLIDDRFWKQSPAMHSFSFIKKISSFF